MASGFQIDKYAVGVQTQTSWDTGPAAALLPGAQGRGRACHPKGEGLSPNREGWLGRCAQGPGRGGPHKAP